MSTFSQAFQTPATFKYRNVKSRSAAVRRSGQLECLNGVCPAVKSHGDFFEFFYTVDGAGYTANIQSDGVVLGIGRGHDGIGDSVDVTGERCWELDTALRMTCKIFKA